MKSYISLILANVWIITYAVPLHEGVCLKREHEAPTLLEDRGITIVTTTGPNVPQTPYSQGQETIILNALDGARALVQKSYDALNNPTDPNVEYIFSEDNDWLRDVVQTYFSSLGDALATPPQGANILIYPDENLYSQLNPEPQGAGDQWPDLQCGNSRFWGWSSQLAIILCPSFFTYNVMPLDCWQTSQAGIIIHMLMHQPAVTSATDPDEFDDNGNYGIAVRGIFSPTHIPDAYQYYAANVANNCVGGLADGVGSEPDEDPPPIDTSSTCSSSDCGDTEVDIDPDPN